METWLKVLLSVILVLVLIGAFVLTYLLNKHTKAPDNCPKAEVGCAGCMLQCGRREEETSITAITKNLVGNYRGEKTENPDSEKAHEEKEATGQEDRKEQ